MKDVFSIKTSQNVRRFLEFRIGASKWVKKDKPKGYREFSFGANSSDDRDEWITTLELLKAKAIHKDFQERFCKIQLPLQTPTIQCT